jgi:hypothetical protein
MFLDNLLFSPSRVKQPESSWTAGSLKMGPAGYSEMLVTDCQSALRNIAEGRRFHLNSYGSLESRKVTLI